MYNYVYRITNTKLQKHYYGVRTSKTLPKQDLGVVYFSSSKDLEFRRDQRTNPQDYKYKIILTCNHRKSAVALEIKLHNKFSVGTNPSFYNRANQTATSFDTTGIKLKELRSYVMSKETKLKLRLANLGKKQSEETISKRVEKLKGHITSDETKAKIGAANRIKRLGTTMPLKQRQRQSSQQVYSFQHTSEVTRTCTVWQLMQEFTTINKSHIWQVVHGSRKSTGGWSLLP